MADSLQPVSQVALAEYERFVEGLISEASKQTTTDRVITGAMGICGEAGELMDHIKKWQYQGHPLDPHYIELELGDLLFYIAVEARANGLTLQQCLDSNVTKLQARYPGGFTPERSLNRVEGPPEARQAECQHVFASRTQSSPGTQVGISAIGVCTLCGARA